MSILNSVGLDDRKENLPGSPLADTKGGAMLTSSQHFGFIVSESAAALGGLLGKLAMISMVVQC